MRSFSRFWYSALSVIPIFYLFSCAPDTTITRKFDNKGSVEYTFKGITPVGSITKIEIEVNKKKKDVEDGFSHLYPIEKENSASATAYSNFGKDETPATDSFTSPTEEEARKTIEKLLNEKGGYGSFVKDEPPYPFGGTDSFSFDYRIIRLDGKDAMIDYIEIKDLEKEKGLVKKETLDAYGIPNCCFFGLPESELILQLNDFISKGYNN